MLTAWIKDRLYEGGAEGAVSTQAGYLALTLGAGFIAGLTSWNALRMLRSFKVPPLSDSSEEQCARPLHGVRVPRYVPCARPAARALPTNGKNAS